MKTGKAKSSKRRSFGNDHLEVKSPSSLKKKVATIKNEAKLELKKPKIQLNHDEEAEKRTKNNAERGNKNKKIFNGKEKENNSNDWRKSLERTGVKALDRVLKNAKLNSNRSCSYNEGSEKEENYSDLDSDFSSDSNSGSDDSDLDIIFFKLKKQGIKTDTSRKKHSKKKELSKITTEEKSVGPGVKKEVPELEKSPESLILNHKRVSRKRFSLLDDELSPKVKKRSSERLNKTNGFVTPLKESRENCSFLNDTSSDSVYKTNGFVTPQKESKENCSLLYNLKRNLDDGNDSESVSQEDKFTLKNCSVLLTKSPLKTPHKSNFDVLNGSVSDTPKTSRKTGVRFSSKHDVIEEEKSNAESILNSQRYRKSRGDLKIQKSNSSNDFEIKEEPRTPSSKVVSSTPTTPLEKARSSLHVSSVPESLPCREREFQNIFSFLENKLLDGIGGCMYISGVPGTGKTATVTQVVNKLKLLAKEKKVPDFKFIEINGMRLADPRQAYIMLWQGLTGKKDRISVDQAQGKLDSWFRKSDPKDMKTPTLLLVDELDLICTKKQDVVYNLLDWPTKSPSRLIVLTIANTMDMPERLFKGRVTSRLGLTRLTFLPYTYKQLEEIILKRLTGLNAFTLDAVRLVTRKVAAVSGDARRSLDICRRATELPAPDETVKISHIEQAIREMTNSNTVKVIRCCSQLEKLFLKSVSDVSSRTGVEEVDFRDVIEHFLALCTLEGYSRLPISHILTISNRLKCFRLLFINQSQNGILQRLTLNVTQDDIHYGMKSDL